MPQPLAMVAPGEDNIFIVISGHHPQKGKRERISRVRTHITKRQHQNRGRQDTNRHQSVVPKPLYNPISTTRYALLSLSSFAEETNRRIHRFFDVHLRGYVDSHPFLVNIVRWSVSGEHPHFASAKLLNASGWDDILESGVLSPWTTQQRFITIRLLNETLEHDVGTDHQCSMVATIQSLLAFELLLGNNQEIERLTNILQRLIDQFTHPFDEISHFLLRGQYMLSYADRLRRAGCDNGYVSQNGASHPYVPGVYLDINMVHQNLDLAVLSLFTFGQPIQAENVDFANILLHELYTIIVITTSSQITTSTRSTIESINAQYRQFLPRMLEQQRIIKDMALGCIEPRSWDTDYRRIAPLRLTIFILTLCLSRIEEEGRSRNLADLSSHLRTLLQYSTKDQPDTWIMFPGALMWCYAIGLRFADPQIDQAWFLMQFLRVTHMWVLNKWDMTSRSIEVITTGLERIGGSSAALG